MGRTRAMSRRSFILDTSARHAVYHDQGEGYVEFVNGRSRMVWLTSCGKVIPQSAWSGAVLPRWRADLIARPCKRCYPEAR